MDSDDVNKIPLREIKMEDGARELTDSDAMGPYVKLATAVMSENGLKEAVEEIRALPLEDRYLWRVRIE